MTEIEPGVTLSIETVNLAEQARAEIDTARELNVDPWVLIRTHRRTADLMERMLADEARSSI